jgi:hypothetical protein
MMGVVGRSTEAVSEGGRNEGRVPFFPTGPLLSPASGSGKPH